MDIRISATELARNVGDVLGRIRYRGDSFLVERIGEAVARAAGTPDPDFARDLEAVGPTDRPSEDPWRS